MKLIALCLACFCGILVYDLYYGHNGIKQYQQISEKLDKEQKQALYLQRRNQEVEDQISDLRQGSIAIEELARSELGLIKPNERFYRVLATDEQIKNMRVY